LLFLLYPLFDGSEVGLRINILPPLLDGPNSTKALLHHSYTFFHQAVPNLRTCKNGCLQEKEGKGRMPYVCQSYREDIATFLAIKNFLGYRTCTIFIEVISQELKGANKKREENLVRTTHLQPSKDNVNIIAPSGYQQSFNDD